MSSRAESAHELHGRDYIVPVVSGAAASLAVSPFMMLIDLSIMRAQLDRTNLREAMRAMTNDLRTGRRAINPAFNIMWGVYGATFVTANTTRQACKDLGMDPVVPVALATSVVNSVICIGLKDRVYPRLLGMKSTATSLPLPSYALFGVRDLITISASFVGKDMARDWLIESKGWDEGKASVAAAFGVPMGAQLFATPFQMLALDVYERPTGQSFLSRMGRVVASYIPVVAGRMVRVLPAYGIGGYLNDRLLAGLGSRHGSLGVGIDIPTSATDRVLAKKKEAVVHSKTKQMRQGALDGVGASSGSSDRSAMMRQGTSVPVVSQLVPPVVITSRD